MFRRSLSISAMVFVAGSLFLTTQPASAQSLGLYGGYFGRPIYFSPYSSPATGSLTSPYGALGPVATPFGGYSAYLATIAPYGMYNSLQPLPSVYASYNAYQPFAPSAGMTTLPFTYRDPLSFSNYVPFAATTGVPVPYMYRDPLAPTLYSLVPGMSSVTMPVTYTPSSNYYRPVTYVGYPNYVYAPGSLAPLPTYYLQGLRDVPYPGMYNAYGLGPTTFAADGIARPSVVAAISSVPNGQGTLSSGTQTARVRPAPYPAVEVPVGQSLQRESIGTTKNNTARMEVTVPSADAEVWFQGTKTKLTGTVREFVSPPLAGTGTYTYEVRARWMAGNEPVTRTQTVRVRAGERVRIDFTTK